MNKHVLFIEQLTRSGNELISSFFRLVTPNFSDNVGTPVRKAVELLLVSCKICQI